MCAYIQAQLNAQRQPTPQPAPIILPKVHKYPTFEDITPNPPPPENKMPDVLHIEHFAPTPLEAVQNMVNIAAPTKKDVLMDLGCGDGRILINAATRFDARCVGIELNTKTALTAINSVEMYDLHDRIRIYKGDVLKFDLKQATIATMYLYPELMEKLIPKLPPRTRIISYSHPIPTLKNYEHKYDTYSIYEAQKE